MNNEEEQSEHAALNQLFDKAGEAPSEPQITRMLGKARAIPAASRERRLRGVWFPVGASALVAAAAAGFWVLDLRGVRSGSEVRGQATRTGVLPPGNEREVGARATPISLRVAGAVPAGSAQAEALQDGSDAVNGDGLVEADEDALRLNNVWAATGADASLLVVEDNADDAELGRAMGAEDLYGPLSEEDVDWWMLATNDLLGGG